MKSIEISYKNEVVQNYQKIKKGQSSRKDYFTLEGLWAYEKLLQTEVLILDLIYCDSIVISKSQQIILEAMKSKAQQLYRVSEKTMARLCDKSLVSCMVAICVKTQSLQAFNSVVVLDGLENPGNIGTIFRSCDGAGIDAIFVVNEITKVNQSKVIKASMGGSLNVPWFHFNSVESCQNWLEDHGFIIYLAHPNQSSKDDNSHEKTAIVVGNERYGLSKQWFLKHHKILSIPMRGCCDSLNVGVAASILIYQKIGS